MDSDDDDSWNSSVEDNEDYDSRYIDNILVINLGSESDEYEEPLSGEDEFDDIMEHFLERSTYGSEDSDSDLWDENELWQPKSGRETPSDYTPHHIERLGIPKLNELREIGQKTPDRKAASKHLLLTLLFKVRWAAIERLKLLQDAVLLLHRKLYLWEGCVFDHLFQAGYHKKSTEEWRGHALLEAALKEKWLLPITLGEILIILKEDGTDINGVNLKPGKTLLVKLVKDHTLHRDSVEFIAILLQHEASVVSKSGYKALTILCDRVLERSRVGGADYALQVIRLLLEAGVVFDGKTGNNPLASFLRNVPRLVNHNAVEILRLFINQGFNARNSLFSIASSLGLELCASSPEKIRSLLEICNILVENGADLTASRRPRNSKEKRRKCFLFYLFNITITPEHPSLLELLRHCVERHLNLLVVNENNENLLISACRQYKVNDLAKIIELLCSKGIRVNHLDRDKRNALMVLAENMPNSRQAIYDAASALLRNGINVNQIDKNGRNALLLFIRNKQDGCCRYGELLELNQSTFWQTLEILVNSGIDVNQVDSENGYTVISKLMYMLGFPWYPSFCTNCLKTYVEPKKVDVEKIGIEHFTGVLRFFDRLFKAGASNTIDFGHDSINVLFYVCARFKGDELIATVKMLCENGIDVNATTMKAPGFTKHVNQYSHPLNAIQVLKIDNPSQIYLVGQLVELMNQYGFNGTY